MVRGSVQLGVVRYLRQLCRPEGRSVCNQVLGPVVKDALVVDPLLGEMSCGLLAQEIGADCYRPVPIPTLGWPTLVSAASATLRETAHHWQLIVGIDLGAMVAAELVQRGQAEQAILLEPFLGFLGESPASTLQVQAREYNKVAYSEGELHELATVVPGELASGKLSDRSIELMFRDRSPAPEQAAYLGALQRTIHAREPLSAQQAAEASVPAGADWMEYLHHRPLQVQVWFSSTVPADLVHMIEERLPPGTVVQNDWPRHAWITQPRRVAIDLLRPSI